MAPRYLIGIDLGTTNSAVGYIDLQAKARGGRPELQTFAVPQLVAAAELHSRNLLPSFLYLPGPHDLPPGATALPWDAAAHDPVGQFARDHGAKVPGRLVSSAKSWLCHPGVDRTAALLPWGGPADVPRVSPVEASTRYLRHLVQAWNHTQATSPDEHLEKLPAVLTVPASFDDVARTLTVEAAKKAGLPNVTLLEEPQAAFYCWMHVSEQANRGRKSAEKGSGSADIKPGMQCLVVDVGGGTSDFSLIGAVESHGDMAFVREAVGDHLLLGGDNMDLALARAAEAKLGGKLDAAQYGALIQACRQAKEALLAPEPPGSFPVTVVGRGRSVVGGTLTTNLTVEDVRAVLYDGFFPAVGRDEEPTRAARAGLHEMGLPYVNDPAVTRHLAAFLKRHLPGRAPDAILFNGGVFQPLAIRQRLLEVMRPWYGTDWQPLLLTTPSLDLAVAWGAASYVWLKQTGGRRIGGGTARSYYVGVETESTPAPVATDAASRTVLCVLPRHLEENDEIDVPGPPLELALGEPVHFPLYTSTVRDDRAGQVLQVAPEQLRSLPPLHTVLRGGKRSGSEARRVPVSLAARATAIGTLELSCVAADKSNRWKLEFNTRDESGFSSEDAAEDGDARNPEAESRQFVEVVPEPLVQAAAGLIRGTYRGEADAPTPADLPKALEAALDAPRHDWPTGLCRRLFGVLMEVAEERRRSPGHLGRWYHLVGYSLRPGFGDPLDRYRIDQLWKLLNAPRPGQSGPPAPEGGADHWVMWRRVAGGLGTPLQQALLDRIRPYAIPGKGKPAAKPGANELAEMWRAAAALERLAPKVKQTLGETLLKQVRKSPAPTYAFWALTRLGARVLLYGPLNAVVHPDIVSGWIDAVLPFQPGHESERTAWAFCLAQLARMSGQRALDIDEVRRAKVLAALHGQAIPAAWPKMVEEVHALGGAERNQMFGDALPIGLRLATG